MGKRGPKKGHGGRPATLRTPLLMAWICSQIAAGRDLMSICHDPLGTGCVDPEMALAVVPQSLSYTNVRKWIADDKNFATLIARAKQDRADRYADEIVTIADTEPDANRARVRVDARKFIVSKLLPKVYGEPQQMLTINNSTNVMVVTEERRQAAIEQHQRLIASAAPTLTLENKA